MNKLNLLPWRKYAQAQQQRKFLLGMTCSILTAVMIICLVNTIIKLQIDHLAQTNKDLQNEITVLLAKIQQADVQQAQSRQILQVNTDLKNINQHQQQLTDLVSILPQVMPIDLHLKVLNLAAHEIVLTGITLSHGDVALFIDRLEKVTGVERVELISIVNVPNTLNEADFEIKVIMK